MSPVKNKKPRRGKPALIGIALVFVLFLALLPLASSQTEEEYSIESYSLYFDLLSDNTVKETIEVLLTANQPFNRYVFYTEYPVENLDAIVSINGNTLASNVTAEKITGGVNAVYVSFPEVNKDDRVKIRISFLTSGMVQEVNGKQQFAYYVRFNQPVGVFYARLFVPRGYAVLSPIIPSPNKVESSANRMILEWKKIQVSAGDEFYFIVGFSEEIQPPRRMSPLWMVIIFISAFTGGFFGGILYKERRERRETKREILKSDEERVLEILKEGPLLQSELVRRLGVSKAKVSILLREMEEKGLIERIREGRSYRIQLKGQ